MYEKINDEPVESFIAWYNETYNDNISASDLDFIFSYTELSILADEFTNRSN